MDEFLATVDKLGASLADKVVGKAVASIVAFAGIVAVNTWLASQTAEHFLNSQGIPMVATKRVPQILNRRGDGPCPLEKLTLMIDDPALAVAKMHEFIATIRD